MFEQLDFLACPLPEDVRRARDCGDLAFCRRLIERRLADGATPDVLKERMRFELRTLQELPVIYPYDEEETLRRFCRRVKGFTREELEALRLDGACDWIIRDGKVYYHRYAVSSAIKTHADLAARLADPAEAEESRAHQQALSDIIGTMKRDGGAAWRYRLETTLAFRPEDVAPGERLLCHMPLPVTSGQCRAGEIRTTPGMTVQPEDTAQRTAIWEGAYRPGLTLRTEAEWRIDAPYVKPEPQEVSADQPRFDTEELLPQIRFTPFLRQLA